MWTKEDIVISFKYDNVPKWQIAPFLRLDKPWNRYNGLEVAEIASIEAYMEQYGRVSLFPHAFLRFPSYRLCPCFLLSH